MKKIIIKNLAGVQTHGAEMEDPTQWISDCVAQNVWGLPERQELDEMGEPTGNTLSAEYTIEITDITAQVEQDKVNADALAYLASTDWLIIRETESGKPCPAEIKTARADARAKIIRG